jgi:hypothetical protein
VHFGQAVPGRLIAHGSMVDRSERDDVDLPALGHSLHVAGIAGDDEDLFVLRGRIAAPRCASAT